MSAVTVIVIERSSPLPPACPSPLIYEVDLKIDTPGSSAFARAGAARDEVLRMVAEERASELGIDAVGAVMDGLDLVFAFKGTPEVVMDWRSA